MKRKVRVNKAYQRFWPWNDPNRIVNKRYGLPKKDYLVPSNPYNGNYAIPKTVLKESGGAVKVDPGLPRGFGMKGPAYITPWAPRGTVDTLVPSQFMGLGTVDGCEVGAFGSLGETILSDPSLVGSTKDPIATFGRQASSRVLSGVKSLPKKDRVKVMRAVLDALDPNIWADVENKLNKAKGRGVKPQAAIQKSLAQSFANHMVRQLKDVYETRRKPSYGVLGDLGCTCEKIDYSLSGLGALGFWGEIGGFFSDVGGKAKEIAKDVAHYGCKAVNNKAIVGISAGVGSVAGSPATGAAIAGGATIAANVCNVGAGEVAKTAGTAAATAAYKAASTPIGGGMRQMYMPGAKAYTPPKSILGGIPTVALAGGGILALWFLLKKK